MNVQILKAVAAIGERHSSFVHWVHKSRYVSQRLTNGFCGLLVESSNADCLAQPPRKTSGGFSKESE